MDRPPTVGRWRSTASSAPRRLIAYLNSEYPSLSHTFIEREIRALRQLGFEIQPFSIRPPGRHSALGQAHQNAARETVCILGSTAALLSSALAAFFTAPLRACRAFIAGQRLSPPGFAARLRHAAYVVEALRLARELRQREIRHVHVHIAN